jgi:sulfur carrier protein
VCGTVRIELNGEPRDVEDGTTIRALLALLGIGDRLVAVERNAEIVPRREHATSLVREGDRIEVVQFVGGG